MSDALVRDRLGADSVATFALTASVPMLVVGKAVTTGWAVTGTIAGGVAMLAMVGCLGLIFDNDAILLDTTPQAPAVGVAR